MAEYWRYADRMAPAQAPVKRMRSEFDDLNPAAAGYYSREEPRFDDRDSRLMLREQESLGMGYGSGLTGTDISGLTGGHLGLGGLGATNLGLPTHDEHNLLGHGGGRMLGLDSGIGKPSTLGLNNGRPDYLTRQDSQGPPRPRVPLPIDASPTLFVEGLPSDCSRREAAHVFRPFYGFKEVRLVRKEGKRSGSALVLCFVDFTDAQHAATAREALQASTGNLIARCRQCLYIQLSRSRYKAVASKIDIFAFIQSVKLGDELSQESIYTSPIELVARENQQVIDYFPGYKFDESSQESESLRLQFARTPGPRGGGRDDFRDRDDFARGGRPFRR